MAVMIAPRDEDRIDALARQVAVIAVRMDEGFKRMDERFERMDERFKRMDERFERVDTELREQRRDMKAGFERVDDRFERLYRVLIGSAAAIIVALIGAPHL